MKTDRNCSYCDQPIPEGVAGRFCCPEHEWRQQRDHHIGTLIVNGYIPGTHEWR